MYCIAYEMKPINSKRVICMWPETRDTFEAADELAHEVAQKTGGRTFLYEVDNPPTLEVAKPCEIKAFSRPAPRASDILNRGE